MFLCIFSILVPTFPPPHDIAVEKGLQFIVSLYTAGLRMMKCRPTI